MVKLVFFYVVSPRVSFQEPIDVVKWGLTVLKRMIRDTEIGIKTQYCRMSRSGWDDHPENPVSEKESVLPSVLLHKRLRCVVDRYPTPGYTGKLWMRGFEFELPLVDLAV